MLDEYWPGCSDLNNIKRGDRMVYKASCNGETKIVKSTAYADFVLQ